jgi:hypothetical protein
MIGTLPRLALIQVPTLDQVAGHAVREEITAPDGTGGRIG